MLKIEIKEGENIERALKRYKRKTRKVKLLQRLKENQYFTKKSVEKRAQKKKAAYREQYLREQSEE
ncbi:30S ribosomal protein S21 [Maribacter sp. 2307ULW6-5]|uniref:30S ribosomal protein S21 n=1 Tax=Maribacter sp. 2307ULW6-5 TaxID=3386275 RepID=UPI0039BC9AF7